MKLDPKVPHLLVKGVAMDPQGQDAVDLVEAMAVPPADVPRVPLDAVPQMLPDEVPRVLPVEVPRVLPKEVPQMEPLVGPVSAEMAVALVVEDGHPPGVPQGT